MPVLKTVILKKWLSLLCVIVATVFLLLGWLPILAEKFLLPRVLPASVISEYKVSVFRLGVGGCSLKVSGQGESPIIPTGNLQIKWSLSGLRNGRVDTLIVDGLQLEIPNVSPGKSPPTSAEKKAEIKSAPMLINSIQVLNSSVKFMHQGHRHTIPFKLVASLKERDGKGNYENSLDYGLHLWVAEQGMQAELGYMFGTQTLRASVNTNLNLHKLQRELRECVLASIDMKGNALVSLQAKVKTNPFSVELLEADVAFNNTELHSGKTLLRSDGESPVLSLKGSKESWAVNVDGVRLEEPVQVVAHFDASVTVSDNSANWDGDLMIQPMVGQEIMPGIVLSEAPLFALQHKGKFHGKELSWDFLSSNENKDSGKFLLNLGDTKISGEKIAIESGLSLKPEHNRRKLDAEIIVKGDDLAVLSPQISMQIPEATLENKSIMELPARGNGITLSGSLAIADGALSLAQKDFSLSGMQLEIPFAWPWVENNNKGFFAVDSISFEMVEVGTLQTELKQLENGITFQGKLTSDLVPDDVVSLEGYLNLPESTKPLADIRFSAKENTVSVDDFSSLVPALNAVSGGGLLNMDGQLALYRDRTDGFLNVGINDGHFELPKLETSIDGVDVQLDFPSFPALRTKPRQTLTIDKVTSKKITLAKIRSYFQIESPDTIFIEEIGACWSGGRVFTSSFRFQKDKPEFEVALLCDRLELSDVITQLGLARATGQGKVSGRIPVLYDEGDFYVDDGFLFSTPGETGTLKITKSEYLNTAVPENVPHFSPIHFAGAALQDFKYDWAKLLVSPEAENLLLKLQIYGKPAEKMPFRFDTRQSVFVRLEEGEKGGIDQPVQLDVNFNVPLNELLRYHKQLQPILRNIK